MYEKHKEAILANLPLAIVEHIGSSAVPFAISKGDLDIYVGVHPAELENAVALLAKVGYTPKSDTFRSEELCMLEHYTLDTAIQVVAIGSKFEFFLAFRDKLRASARLLADYNELKQSCADKAEDE